jgi:hypothetical protein
MSAKYQQPKLPRLEQRLGARAKFFQANAELREARQKYKLAVWHAAEHLHGRALLRFALQAVRRMRQAGLYAAAYQDTDAVYCMIRFFYHQDTGSPTMQQHWDAWGRWRAQRGLSDGIRIFVREAA